MILAADSGIERSTALRSRPAGNGFLRLVLAFALAAAHIVMNASRSRIWTMPTASSSVSSYTTRRE